jgi:hypothetical protein
MEIVFAGGYGEKSKKRDENEQTIFHIFIFQISNGVSTGNEVTGYEF